MLVQQDPKVTTIDLTASTPIQVARGSAMTDADGTRQVTAMFPRGVTATMKLADGTSQPVTTLTVHATEYTVGSTRNRRCPGRFAGHVGLHLRGRVRCRRSRDGWRH